MSKGRSGPTVYEKQQSVIDGFTREIRNDRNRTQLNATEQAIQRGIQNRAYVENLKAKPVISFHNPDAPLKGSKYWSEEQWVTYKAWLRNKKAEDKLNANK